MSFAVLAEPSRRDILDVLRDGEQPVGALVHRLGMSQPLVSKHLRVLRDAGLVDVRADAQRRLYRLRPEPLADIDAWLAPYRQLWTPVARSARATPRKGVDMSDGELILIDGRAALRFERRYRQPVERVWQAITAPDEMAAWFPARVEGSRVVGAELRFVDEAQRAAAIAAGEPTRAEGPEFRGTVLVHDPPHVFSFTWGGEILRYELHPDHDGTRLVFTQVLGHRVTASRNGAGWHMCLAGLDRLLDEPTRDESGWDEVFDRYVTRIGPPLGTPGDEGAMTWGVATHLDAQAVRAALARPTARDVWGSGELDWEIHPDPHGATLDVTRRAIGHDAHLAATWHARMVQLDMYLASGQLPAVDPARWVEPYRELLNAVDDRANEDGPVQPDRC